LGEFPVQEAGESNVHPITRKLAKIKSNNANRDLFRFMPCPLDIVYCECAVRTEPGGDNVEMRKLGMFDPHELLDYLWRNDHIRVPFEEIQTLILNKHHILFGSIIEAPY